MTAAVAEKPKRKFQVRDGMHAELNPAWREGLEDADPPVEKFLKYKKGDIVESSVDLAARYANRFDPYVPAAPPEIVTVTVEKIVEVEKKFESPLGDDVTAKFPEASAEGLLVFANAAGKHQVTTRRNTKKPVNKTPLEAADVDKWVLTAYPEAKK